MKRGLQGHGAVHWAGVALDVVRRRGTCMRAWTPRQQLGGRTCSLLLGDAQGTARHRAAHAVQRLVSSSDDLSQRLQAQGGHSTEGSQPAISTWPAGAVQRQRQHGRVVQPSFASAPPSQQRGCCS
jgi:hypothetical protein